MLKKPSLDRNDGGADHLPSLGKKKALPLLLPLGGIKTIYPSVKKQ